MAAIAAVSEVAVEQTVALVEVGVDIAVTAPPTELMIPAAVELLVEIYLELHPVRMMYH